MSPADVNRIRARVVPDPTPINDESEKLVRLALELTDEPEHAVIALAVALAQLADAALIESQWVDQMIAHERGRIAEARLRRQHGGG